MSEDVDLNLLADPGESIPDYKTAYHLVDEAVRSHHNHWELSRAIQDHIEGKKPKNPVLLKKQGLSWSSNWNFGKAKMQVEKSVIELTKKVTDGLTVGIPEFILPDKNDERDELTQFLYDPNDRGRVATILGYSFSRALEEDGDLYHGIGSIEYNSYTFGYASVAWKSFDWVFESIPVTKIAFKPGSTAANIDTWVIFRTEKAIDLYRHLTRVHNKKERGDTATTYWKVDALKKVVTWLYLGRKNDDGARETWNDIAPRYNADPCGIIADTEDLNIAIIYTQEVDGSITETYIPWGYEWQAQRVTDVKVGNRADQISEILYKRTYTNTSWKKFLRIVRDSGFTETGDIHSMRGMGKPATENGIRYNRLRNTLTDKSMLVGSPMFEQPSTQVGKKFELTQSSGFTLLTPGYVPLPNQPSYDINSHLQIINHEDKEFDELTSHYRNDATGALSSRPTKDEVQLAQAEVTRIRSSKDKIKFRDYSGVFLEVLKKMGTATLKSHHQGYAAQKKFFKLVKEALPDVAKSDSDVRKIVGMVDGYTIDLINMDISSLQMALQMSETPFARNRLKRIMLIAQGFSIREVNLMVPVVADKYRAFDDRRMALIENDMFWSTSEVLYSETDDDIIHLEEHDRKLNDTFNQLRQNQLDVIQAYDFVVRLYTHMFSHIDTLIKDPVLKGEGEDQLGKMREYKKVIGQISYARAQELRRREEEAQMENPGISPKDQHDMRLAQAKAEAAEQRNEFKTQQRGRLKEAELQLTDEQKKRKIELDHQADLLKIEKDAQAEILKARSNS